jgi:hypothetical protein
MATIMMSIRGCHRSQKEATNVHLMSIFVDHKALEFEKQKKRNERRKTTKDEGKENNIELISKATLEAALTVPGVTCKEHKPWNLSSET